MEEKKLQETVAKFMDHCSDEVGKFESDMFHFNTTMECLENRMESPIEQILYSALKAICIFNFIEFNDTTYISETKKYASRGLSVEPQRKIGKYRVDFIVGYSQQFQYQDDRKCVVVECDSQKFHERTEPERRYEKQRDRYLQGAGYKVFHFTGSEIVSTPISVAKEILFEIAYPYFRDKEEIWEDSNVE